MDEQTWRQAATDKGFSLEQQDAYIEKHKDKFTLTEQPVEQPAEQSISMSDSSTKLVVRPGFDEAAFRRKAEEKGYSVEAQDAYVAKQMKQITVDPSLFAEPDVNRPWMVKPSLRSMVERGVITHTTPEQAFHLDDKSILRIADTISADPSTKDGINAIYKHAEREENWRQDKSELVATIEEYANADKPFKWLKSNFNSAAESEWKSMKARNIENIATLAEERGLTLTFIDGEFFAPDPNGTMMRVTPEFLQSIGKAKYEMVTGVVGAITGAKLASKLPTKSPYAKIGAIAVGGLAGSVIGEEADYLITAIQLHEELNAKIATEKAIGSAQIGIIGEAVGLGVGALGVKSWRGIRHAYDYVKDGNTQGAYAALKDALGYLDDTQVEDIIGKWERLHSLEAPGTRIEEKALSILPRVSPGGEEVASSAARLNPRVAITLRSDLNKRATDVIAAVKNPSDNTGALLESALRSYTNEVKASYGIVKNQASDIVATTNPGYVFNLPNLALRPALEETIDKIADPVTVNKLQRLLMRVEDLTDSRTFDDLLELRELLNEFKYASKVTSKSKFVANEAITAARDSVDAEIDKVLSATPEGVAWLADWKDVNKAYGEYKMLTKNALYKLINKEGAGERDIAKALVKYGDALDDTYTDVVSKLPVKVKATVENEIIQQLTLKHTQGKGEAFKAVSFPELADELKYYSFDSSKAIQMKEVVNRFAEVYRNDRELFKLTGQLKEGVGQSIAMTIWGKVKMATVNKLWTVINQLKPGSAADITALVDKSAKLLENPLDKKIVESVLKDVGEDFELTAAIKRLQAETAKQIAEGTATPRAQLFKDARTGQLYLKEGPRRAKLSETVPYHRIMKSDQLFEIVGKDVQHARDLTKAERIALVDKGYLLVTLENGAVIDLR